MKLFFIIMITLLTMASTKLYAQQTYGNEGFGRALNLGIGIGGYSGYYSYTGRTLPVFNLNYELSVAKNFTIAPFVSLSSRSESYYWGDNNHDYKYYYYRETIIPLGLKGTYYFDQLLRANANWDFYIAGSLGFVFISSRWETDYYGDEEYYNSGNPLFLDFHVGTEYHFNNRIGAFLDFSTGVSTIGIAFH